jgi:hypothetical protein
VYLFFYAVLGMAWVGAGRWVFALFGIGLRDDVLERRNPAALWAICGAGLGLSFCFAGANIGDGPGWWVVLTAALISTAAWFICWQIYESMTRVADHITIDRDPAAGWRLAGYLSASGLILGRAVAGDWHSLAATWRDFFTYGWPVVILLMIATVVENFCRPTPESPRASPVLGGFVPAYTYLACAVTWIVFVGPGN